MLRRAEQSSDAEFSTGVRYEEENNKRMKMKTIHTCMYMKSTHVNIKAAYAFVIVKTKYTCMRIRSTHVR